MYRRLILGVVVLTLMNGMRLAADDPKPAAKENAAERLFRQMQKKLSEANLIECVIETKPGPGQGVPCTTRLFLADGNKLRLEMDPPPRGAEFPRVVCISDGTKLVAKTGGDRRESDVPKSLNQEALKVLTLAGVGNMWFKVVDPVTQDGFNTEGNRFAAKLYPSGFTLGKKEKVNGRAAQIIEYELKQSESDDSSAAAVWIDTKTSLPLKLMLTERKGGKLYHTETYTKLTLGGKIDKKKFALSK
jgi:outer membrane lipoprotein-sorting protein